MAEVSFGHLFFGQAQVCHWHLDKLESKDKTLGHGCAGLGIGVDGLFALHGCKIDGGGFWNWR